VTDEAKITLLGVLDTSDREALAIALNPDTSIAEIQAAILRANAERAAAAKRETEALARMFLDTKVDEK
jgi:hypothetical protein